ncbi:hypothetical protein E2C01_050848 [Portunus trituberculatus]|uniref:Uncharacterized protein n=1 Tax=Portunus trituberculatus TaxID=210409 RepID=A0A5B7GD68_PORTR|nr:hypothetical protein [Portunus trituberculatus]
MRTDAQILQGVESNVSYYTIFPLKSPLVLNLFSIRTCFHIHSAYYLVIFYSYRNSCGDLSSKDFDH